MAMVVWLFVALVITQSYTANLTSMLTVQQIEPTVDNVDSLLNSNAMVGYSRGSFVRAYLETVLHFKSQNIKQYNLPEEYSQALRSKEITAAFLEVPWAKLFLAQYCKGFIIAGPTYKVGGFGFVFPTGSPLLPDITKALLEVSESGMLYELEKNMIGTEKCVNMDSNEETYRLSPNSFVALFIITGGTSTIALVIYVICWRWNLNDDGSMLEHRTIWRLMFAVMKHWRRRRIRFGRRVSNAETTPRTNTNAFNMWIRVFNA